MNTKTNQKGFTLAELLIVVAIIGVLVAISIPIFSGKLEQTREATDLANIRAAYAEACHDAMLTDNVSGVAYTAPMTQKKAGWEYFEPVIGSNYYISDTGLATGNILNPTEGQIIKISVDEAIFITFATKEEANTQE